MKTLLTVAILLSACSSGPDLIGDSRDTFNRRASESAEYEYVSRFSSWAGFGNDTTVTVENGAVVKRAYRAWENNNETGIPTTTTEWTEEGATLGSHTEVGPLQTLDDLYDVCENDILTVDESDNTITLTFDDSGILATCVYVPNGCQDDCSVGINLSSVTFTP